jgi:hypothetical protein
VDDGGNVDDGACEVAGGGVVADGEEEWAAGLAGEHADRPRAPRTSRHADGGHRTAPSWCPVVVEGKPVSSGGAGPFSRSVRSACPGGLDCLRWAIEHNEREGIWVGTSARKRQRIRAESRRGERPKSGGLRT